jgi:dTDP-glucose 4,6-dehydratase
MDKKLVYYIDIDGTICTSVAGGEYGKTIPFTDRIEKYNNLYDEGHTVIYWTARGTTTGVDWKSVTEQQLNKWGVKYHELKLGKPYYDVFIDDKSINPNG